MAKPLLKEDMSEAEDANHFVIRCRGLPWSTTKDEVVNFFDDCKFKDGEESVHLTLTREGRPSGEAYIEVDLVPEVATVARRSFSSLRGPWLR